VGAGRIDLEQIKGSSIVADIADLGTTGIAGEVPQAAARLIDTSILFGNRDLRRSRRSQAGARTCRSGSR
jgi:hypothetical protein